MTNFKSLRNQLTRLEKEQARRSMDTNIGYLVNLLESLVDYALKGDIISAQLSVHVPEEPVYTHASDRPFFRASSIQQVSLQLAIKTRPK